MIALASARTYDPAVWSGGISEAEYQRLLSGKTGKPLVSRAIRASSRPVRRSRCRPVSAMLRDGYPLHGKYDCPVVLHESATGRSTTSAASGLGVLNLHMRW
ncbi:hypothetical protein [Streptosporangium vulgare]|uniref:hypothetical protein n=1 Tax=Streptosporangium vulgare TaxID=46190 RepID=UPI0031CEFC16